MAAPIYGAIEGGGSKFALLLASDPDRALARGAVPTSTPDATLAGCIRFFQRAQAEHHVTMAALGVACFGPVDLDHQSPTYGYVTATPKPGWHYADIVGPLRRAFGLPVGWDHDVVGALLGERRWGAAQGVDPVLYITVGTGVGVGVFANGAPVHGLLHPEAGHLSVRRLAGDTYPGDCPFHGDCLEGLVCAPAIVERAQRTNPAIRAAADVPLDDPLWDIVATYLAMGIANLTLTLSPQRIVLGGGVMRHQGLMERIHTHLREHLHGYLNHPLLLHHLDRYVVPPQLGDAAGICGALELARLAEG
jgi:fructokinase